MLTLGTTLAAWRKARRLTQQQVAAQRGRPAGLCRHSLSRIENGHKTPTLAQLAWLAELYRIPVETRGRLLSTDCLLSAA